MRVLIFSQPNSEHTRRFVEQSVNNGIQVGIVTNYDDICLYPPGIKKYSMHRIYSTLIPGTGLFKMRLHARAIANDFKPDLVHGHYVSDSGLRAFLSGARPLVLTAWGSDVLSDPKNMKWLRYMLFRKALSSANVITADSQDVLDLCKKWAPKSMFVNFRFGINRSLFKQESKNTELLKQLHLPKNAFIIFSPRNARPLYNHELCIESLTHLPIDVFLLLKYFDADNVYLKKLKDHAETHGVSERVRWISRVDYNRLPDYYSVSDVVVSVPFQDALPVTFFEAWGTGIPLIVNRLPSYRDVIEDGENALVINNNDAKELALAIHQIYSDLNLKEKLRNSGFTSFKLYGDMRKEFNKIIQLYNSLV